MISVCIATYNGANFIAEQLKSILIQLQPDDEVILSDDCSTDNTLDVVFALADNRIRVLQHTHNEGVTANFNIALQEAKGDIIFLCDQDDIWFPYKVKRCMEELQHCDLVVHDGQVTDGHLHIVHSSLFELINAHEGLLHNLAFCGFYGSAMAFHRHVLDAAMPLPQGRYAAHDWWIGLVAELIGSVHFLREPLYFYRRHAGTITDTNSRSLLTRSSRSLKDKILSRVYMLFCITKYKLTHNNRHG